MKPLTRLWRPIASGLKLRFRPQWRSLNHQDLSQRDPRQRPTPMQSMREFFMHPLTWDRNNGYFNVVLALTIFGFVFFNSCSGPCDQKSGLEEQVAADLSDPKRQATNKTVAISGSSSSNSSKSNSP